MKNQIMGMFSHRAVSGITVRSGGVFWVTILMVMFLSARPSVAEDISFQATVDRKEVTLGSSFQLSLTIKGTQNVGPIELPAIAGVDAQYVGPAQNVSVINGQFSASIAHNYRLFPKEAGTIFIPSFTLQINGDYYNSDPIAVEVVAEPSDGGTSAAMRLEDKIFTVVRVPKTDVYINEAVPVKLMLFVNGLDVRDLTYPQIENPGVTVSDFSKPKQYTQVVNGIQYNIVEFNTILYPTRAGTLTVGPVTLNLNILSRHSGQRSSGGFFDDDFFNSFFDRYERQPVTVKSDEIQLAVADLPAASRPADFSGAVGKYVFKATLAPEKVNVGDPLTLKMEVSGEGNLGSVKFPEFTDNEQFRFYEPKIRQEGQSKFLEQVVIPRSAAVSEFPAIVFSYFDSGLKQYQTLKQGPFPLDISTSQVDGSFKVVGLDTPSSAPSKEDEKLGQDINFIKESIGNIRPIKPYLYQRISFYLLLFLLIGVWAGGFIYVCRQDRMQTDVRYARKSKAGKLARKNLEQADRFLNSGDAQKFYDFIFKTLTKYLEFKLHIPAGSITRDAVGSQPALKTHAPLLGQVEQLLEECDRVRYALATIDRRQMEASLKRLEQVVDYCERNVR